MRSRSAEARSRRFCGLRPLKFFGTRIRVERRDRRREVDQRQPARLPVGGHDVGPRAVAATVPGSITTAQPGELAGRYLDHVARLEPRQRVERPRRAGRPAGPGAAPFSASEIRRRSAAYSMKSPRWQVAASAVALERVLALAQLPGQPDHRLVGLELRERLLQQLARASSRPNWCTRLTAMLYDGRNDDRSG